MAESKYIVHVGKPRGEWLETGGGGGGGLGPRGEVARTLEHPGGTSQNPGGGGGGGELETHLLDVLLDITLEGSHQRRDALVVVDLERERRGKE